MTSVILKTNRVTTYDDITDIKKFIESENPTIDDVILNNYVLMHTYLEFPKYGDLLKQPLLRIASKISPVFHSNIRQRMGKRLHRIFG